MLSVLYTGNALKPRSLSDDLQWSSQLTTSRSCQLAGISALFLKRKAERLLSRRVKQSFKAKV